jgi:hypothetical protein
VRRRRPPRHGWRRRGGCAPLRATQVAPTPMLPLSNARALCPRGGKPATSPRLFPASPARPPRISRFFQIWPDISFADSDTNSYLYTHSKKSKIDTNSYTKETLIFPRK